MKKFLIVLYALYVILLTYNTFSSSTANYKSLAYNLGLKSQQKTISGEYFGSKFYNTDIIPNPGSYFAYLITGSFVAGGIYLLTRINAVSKKSNEENNEQELLKTKLAKLENLKNEGILTQGEYDYKRQDVIKQFEV